MPLHIDHRPKTFKTFFGNRTTLQTLKPILRKESKPHSYLFIGPTGCGKTTLARIIAKKFKCSDHDFKEVDSADFRGIDTIRDIRSKMHLRPLSGPCRVYFIDECHKLTNDAQNALLKALEHPPSHVYFILATTDPQKLLPTIRGRCSTFEVHHLSDIEMLDLLKSIVKKEKKTVPIKVLKQIVMDSMGHPRNALVILDQVIDLKKSQMLSAAKKTSEREIQSIELCRALIYRKPWKSICKILKGLDEDPERIRRGVRGYAGTVLLNEDNVQAYLVMSAFEKPFYDDGKGQLIQACYEAIMD